MHNQDKGLVNYKGQPLVSYAIKAMSPLVTQILISANRNHDVYQQWGWPVIADQSNTFDGPLAGILSAMSAAQTDLLLVMPCDSPLITRVHLQRLLAQWEAAGADVAVAFDGERLHPVFLAIKRDLQADLQAYLDSAQRKMARWLTQQKMVTVDFSNEPEVFVNINTLPELMALEALIKT